MLVFQVPGSFLSLLKGSEVVLEFLKRSGVASLHMPPNSSTAYK
jgi:hypothetical protein